jgi:4-hydroxy 2-oxovalerate aldolase
MQIAGRGQKEVEALAKEASKWPLDVLYFADSLGGMDPQQTTQIIGWLRKYWQGDLGIHTHDNLGMALLNTLAAHDAGVTWLDSTVTGMGRGPGNAKTEQLALEVCSIRGGRCNLVPLMNMIREYFQPLQAEYGWGTNTYYYLAGKYGIHPTFIQEMLGDSRYDSEDILAVIDHLRAEGGNKFSFDTLDSARHFYQGVSRGDWAPYDLIDGREVLILGSGPGVEMHRLALESYIQKAKPIVMALNAQTDISPGLIDVRLACHPVRLLADCEEHARLPQPLITPASMLPVDVKEPLASKKVYDYGMEVKNNTFEFTATSCIVPSFLVIAYALAVATSGKATQILLAGFNGYGADDPRTAEMQHLLNSYQECSQAVTLTAVTPTRYNLPVKSIYAM